MNLHCIGIGTPVMCHLALFLAEKGHTVTGSDAEMAPPVKKLLAAKGLLPKQLGWDPKSVHNRLDAVIVGTATGPDNPELRQAQALGLKQYSYLEFLYEQCQYKTRVVVAGSRGKAPITAIVLQVLRYHNLAIDYCIATPIMGIERMVHLSEDCDFVLLEADEGLASSPWQHYRPNIALLSDISWEATEAFPTFEAYRGSFQTFVEAIVQGGSLTYNEEDPEVKKLVDHSEHPIRKLPYHTPYHQIIDGIPLLDTPEGAIPLEGFSKALLGHLEGARWLCQHLGLDATDFYEALASFTSPSLLG